MKSKPKSTFAILYFLGRPPTQLECARFVYTPISDSKRAPVGYIRVQLVRAESQAEAYLLDNTRKDEVMLKAVFPGDIAGAEWRRNTDIIDKVLAEEEKQTGGKKFFKVWAGGTTARPAGAPGAQRK